MTTEAMSHKVLRDSHRKSVHHYFFDEFFDETVVAILAHEPYLIWFDYSTN